MNAPAPMLKPMISIQGLSKTYAGGVRALHNINLEVPAGEFLVILGPSGAGKSTLLRCINRLVDPSEGKVFHDGVEITAHHGDLRAVRRQFGMVFQQFNLVKRLSVLTNVLTGRLGYRSAWRSLAYSFPEADKRIAIECLARVNMDHKAFQRADTLSGGEQQRVAIARALVNRPPVILADEPTAPLDSERALTVIRLLEDMAGQFSTAIIVVTHDEKIIPTFKRIYTIRDGRTLEEAGEGRSIEGDKALAAKSLV